MLNPTDYAAYSRATGRPYPENEEERAQMYGEVRNFRNNQLKNQDKNNIGENIAIGALGLGGLALGTAAGRRVLANRKAQKAASSAGGRRGGVGFGDLSVLEAPAGSYGPNVEFKDYPGGSLALREQPTQTVISDYDSRKVAQDQFASSLEAPAGSYGPNVEFKDYPLTRKQKVYQETAAKPVSELPPVSRPQGGEDIDLLTDPVTGEIYRSGGQASIRKQKAQEALSKVNNRVDQLLADVSVGEAGEMLAGPEVAAKTRQMTGTESSRQSAAVRRQEKQEESLAKNILSELAAETPAQMSELSPREQAFYNSLETDESRSRYLKEVKTRFKDPTLTETYEEFGEPAARIQNIDALNTAADQAAAPIEREFQRNEDVDVGMAQRFLNNKREKLEGQGLSPTRVERVLASDPATAEAAELYASTGDESVLSRFSEQPASPVAVNEVKKVKAEEILKEIQQENTLVEYQKNREPLIEEQSAAALNTAEDQSDSRFLRELQRNEDVDMTMVNEDVIDAASTQTAQDALFRENQLVQDARDYLIRQEIDLKYDYTPEESRQAAAVGQALERIQNNPTRVAAEGIIDELRTEARAVADRARFAKEQRQGKTGELFGYRDVDNIRQRREQKTLSAIDAPRETIESVLTGEDAPIETNLQGRQLRGGKVDADRSYINVDGELIDRAGDVIFYGAGAEKTAASTGARVAKQGEKYKPKVQLEAMFNRYSDDELEQIASNKARIPYGDMMQQDLDELQTAQRVLKTRAQTSMDKGVDMSGPQYRALSRGRKGLEASETSRKRFENQPPVPASQPVQDVARSMETLRQGMSVEPSEAAPVTPDIRNIGIGFEGDKEIIGAIGPSDAYTGAARDAAGSLKNVVVGESAPLVQGDVVSNPEVAAQIEDQSQAFLQRAISGGLIQKATPAVEVYETPRFIGPSEAGPGRVPLSRTAAPDPQRGPEPSQRLGYARYYVGPEATGSKPAGVVTGVSPTVNIDYASMPQSDVYRPSDVGRVVYQGPVQTSAERLSQSTGGLARPMSILPDRGDTRLTSSLPVPQYDPRYKTLNRSQYNPPAPGYTDIVNRPAPTGVAPIGPLTQSPGLPKIGRQVREGSGYYPGPGQKESTYLTQYGQNIRYPHMRGQERFTTEQLMNDPNLRGGPVKMPNRFRDQFVVERPRGY